MHKKWVQVMDVGETNIHYLNFSLAQPNK